MWAAQGALANFLKDLLMRPSSAIYADAGAFASIAAVTEFHMGRCDS